MLRIPKHVLVATAVLCSVAACSNSGDDTPTKKKPDAVKVDPRTVALPRVTASSSAIQAFFSAAGAPLVRYARESNRLSLTRASRAECEAALATLKAKTAPPPALIELASQVPDPATGEILSNDIYALQNLLARCLAGDDVKTAAAEHLFTTEVLARRLTELKVANS